MIKPLYYKGGEDIPYKKPYDDILRDDGSTVEFLGQDIVNVELDADPTDEGEVIDDNTPISMYTEEGHWYFTLSVGDLKAIVDKIRSYGVRI